MKQLPKGYNIVPSRLSSNFLEQNFEKIRSKNAHATARGMDGQLANIGGQMMQNLMYSRKANTDKQNVYRSSELDDVKVKRQRIR